MRTRKRRGGSFDIMSPVPDIDFILLDIETIKYKTERNYPELSRSINTIDALKATPNFEKYKIETIDPTKLNHTLQLYVVDTKTAKIICIISFIIDDDSIGYIGYVTSYNKSDKYKHSSFLGFYQVLKIFEHLNVRHCFLTVVPDENRYWKLYQFYGSMGFQCLPIDKSGRGNIENIKKLSPNERNINLRTRRNTNRFLENKKNTKEHSLKNFEEYIYRCNDMIGNVSDILKKLKTILNIE